MFMVMKIPLFYFNHGYILLDETNGISMMSTAFQPSFSYHWQALLGPVHPYLLEGGSDRRNVSYRVVWLHMLQEP